MADIDFTTGLGANAEQDSTNGAFVASRAVDDDDGIYAQGNLATPLPWWWKIDLGENRDIYRWTHHTYFRLDDFTVTVAESADFSDGVTLVTETGNTDTTYDSGVVTTRTGRYVKIDITKANGLVAPASDSNVQLYELQIMGARPSIEKALSEAFATTDSVATQLKYSRGLSEPLAISDSVVSIQSIIQLLNETLSISESIVRKTIQSLSETVSVSDGIATQAEYIRGLSEALSYLVSLIKTPKKELTVLVDGTARYNESITEYDDSSVAYDGSGVFPRLFIADSKTFKLAQVLTEAFAYSDSVVKSIGKAISETLSITEAIIKNPIKALSESFSLAEALRFAVSMGLSETVSISDSLAKNYIKALSEVLAIADSIVKTTGLSLSQAFSIVDIVLRWHERVKGQDTWIEESDITTTWTEVSDTIKNWTKEDGRTV